MADEEKLNKSQVIRDVHTKHPELGPSALREKVLKDYPQIEELHASQISTVLAKMREDAASTTPPAKRGRPPGGGNKAQVQTTAARQTEEDAEPEPQPQTRKASPSHGPEEVSFSSTLIEVKKLVGVFGKDELKRIIDLF